MQQEIQKGRIRYIGLSNETPWGTMKFLHLAEQLGLSKFVSVQNPYNLLNRTYEIGMSEIAHYEGVGLLAYSPLAFGYLTGKFRHGARPANARVTLYSRFSRYSNPQSEWATEQYAQLAETTRLEFDATGAGIYQAAIFCDKYHYWRDEYGATQRKY